MSTDISTNIITPLGAVVASTLATILAREVWAEDFGALGDGVTNDAPAIQTAINSFTGTPGGTLRFRARTYLINSAVTVSNVPIAFRGMGTSYGFGPGLGTTLLTSNPAIVPFTFTGGSHGSTIRDLGVSQVHAAPANSAYTSSTDTYALVAWTPTAYPYFFQFIGLYSGFLVDNVEFYGVNKGIYATGCGHFHIEWIFGQWFNNAVWIENCADTPFIGKIKHWGYNDSNINHLVYQQANLDVLLLGRVDGLMLGTLHAFAARSAIHCYQEPANAYSGISSGGGIAQFLADTISADQVFYGVWADSLNNGGTEFSYKIKSLDHNCFNVANQNAIPIPGGAILSLNAQANMVCSVDRLDTGYNQTSAVYVVGNGITLMVNQFSMNTPNFSSVASPASMINVGLAGSGNPNLVSLGTCRIFNPRGAVLFGGTGYNPNGKVTCVCGPYSADGQGWIASMSHVP